MQTAVVPTDYTSLLQRIYRLNPFSEYLFTHKNTRHQESTEAHLLSSESIPNRHEAILLDNHVDKHLIRDLMGHTDISVTENYYHRNRKQMNEKVKIINELPEWLNDF